jgi:hypothetical protein
MNSKTKFRNQIEKIASIINYYTNGFINYVALTLLIQGVSGIRHASVSNTNTTPTQMTTFNYVILSNYQCWRISVVSGVCVNAS